MGLPTTANYIVVSTYLMAPVVVELGRAEWPAGSAASRYICCVFYFGLMADVTPPVGLASYAAAGIARCDPIRSGHRLRLLDPDRDPFALHVHLQYPVAADRHRLAVAPAAEWW